MKKTVWENFSDLFLGGKDINAWMVKNGWALAYVKYSKKYLKEQDMRKRKDLEYGKVNSWHHGIGGEEND